MKRNLAYTTIIHEFRRQNELSCLEYVLLDMIYHLQVSPRSAVKDWCYMKRETMAEEIGITKQGLLNMINRLVEAEFLIKNDETKFLKTTEKWQNVYFTDSKQTLPSVNKVDHKSKESLPTQGKESLPLYNSIIIKDNNIDKSSSEKEILKNDFSEKVEDDVPDFVKANRRQIAPAMGGRALTRENLKEDLMSNDYCRMQASRDGIKEGYEQAVDEFVNQKFGIEENLKWKDIQDARRNFTNWIPYQAKRINQNGNSTEKSARIIRFDENGNAIPNGDTSRPFQPNNNGQKNKSRLIILGADQLPDFSNVGQ